MKLVRIPKVGVIAFERDAEGTALITADQMFASRLTLEHRNKYGELVESRDLGSGLVTTEFCTILALALGGTAGNITTFRYHDSGTGTAGAAIGDVDLQTVAGPTTRATGSQSPATVVYTTVGTIAYTGGLAITEWGLFSTSARATTEILDHKVFTAVNVVSGDSIQFTYALTVTAGG
jgi:hypothetical protein